MAYTKNTWVDQDVERPKTYEVTNNQDGSITLTDSFGLVTDLGTPVNAVNMNHIEDGIDGCAIRKHNLTETFALGEWVLGGSDDDEGIYKSLIANNVGNAITDEAAWEKVEMGGGGTSRNIGEIVASTIPLVDAGLHLLDGALIDGYGIYSKFVEYIASIYDASASYFCSEADWQTSVNTYGVCGKFVYDSVNNTVRLPKVTGILEGTTDVTALGDLVEAGLPNIVGQVSTVRGHNLNYVQNGALKKIQTATYAYDGYEPSGGSGVFNIEFDASRSNSIFGNSTTVQPQTIKCYYYIVIATSTKTDIQVDIDEVATDLNGKADTDLANTTNQAKILMSEMAMPSNTYTDLTLGASGATYTAPANGWFAYGANSANCLMSSSTGLQTISNYVQNFAGCSTFIPVKKGDIVTLYYTGTANYVFRFVYAEGSESEAQ